MSGSGMVQLSAFASSVLRLIVDKAKLIRSEAPTANTLNA
jgi:hypothetical protein